MLANFLLVGLLIVTNVFFAYIIGRVAAFFGCILKMEGDAMRVCQWLIFIKKTTSPESREAFSFGEGLCFILMRGAS